MEISDCIWQQQKYAISWFCDDIFCFSFNIKIVKTKVIKIVICRFIIIIFINVHWLTDLNNVAVLVITSHLLKKKTIKLESISNVSIIKAELI